MKKVIVIFFSAALGISFLFIGFGSYFGQNYIIKIGKTKITNNEFIREFDNYKIEKKLNNLSEEENLYSKIQFTNKYVSELVFEEYLNNKIKISDNSKKVILKKSLNNNEMFNNLDEATLQNYLKEITNSINLDIFNNSLNAQELVNLDINQNLLKEKELIIYEIEDSVEEIKSEHEKEYFEDYNLYVVYVNQYDVKTFIQDELITPELLKNFYNENISKYTKNNNYTYEQIISDKVETISFNELKNRDYVQYKLFENIDEKLILPKIKLELEKIEIDETSQYIEIGNKYFYIKKISYNEKKVMNFDDVKETLYKEIIDAELKDFNFTENKESLKKYLQENVFYSNSFNFSENIPNKFNFINFNDLKGQSIIDNYLYDFSIVDIDKDDLKSENKKFFLTSYAKYKKNIEKKHNEDELKNKGTVKVNYFTDSLTIKGFFISKNDLENIVSIKEDDLLKVTLPNEVIYLKLNSIGSIDPINIKQNIVNQIYSKIIEQIKKDIKIEVNNEQLLKL